MYYMNLNANSYLTDADRDHLRTVARTYAVAQGWTPAHVEAFPAYHANRNEAFRQAVEVSATQFRIVKEF